jgi:hypothetical protein
MLRLPLNTAASAPAKRKKGILIMAASFGRPDGNPD